VKHPPDETNSDSRSNNTSLNDRISKKLGKNIIIAPATERFCTISEVEDRERKPKGTKLK
jgi:hypothetical protein